MVEIGELSIGGNIQTNQIESGLNRIEDGFNDVKKSSNSVNSDFERLNQGTLKLSKRMGTLAIAGGGAMIAIAKNAPATAGAMAKIKVQAQQLQFAVGEALQDEFNTFANLLEGFGNWVEDNPNLFSKIVSGITILGGSAIAIKAGGWIYGAFSGFWGLLKGISGWTGWSTLKSMFSGVGKWVGKGLSAVSGVLGGSAGAMGASAGVGGLTTGLGALPLINTYQRELGGEGFIDQYLQKRKIQRIIIDTTKQEEEKQLVYL